jgi:hypothetical protein
VVTKEGRPIPIRFPLSIEKSMRVYAIEKGITLSAAIREMVRRGLASMRAPDPPKPEPGPPLESRRRRVLSRGVG